MRRHVGWHMLLLATVVLVPGPALAQQSESAWERLLRPLGEGDGSDWRDRMDDVLTALETPDPAETRGEIDHLLRDVADAVNGGQIDDALAHATEDASLVLPNGRLVQGKDEIRRFYALYSGPGPQEKLVRGLATHPTIDGLTLGRGGLMALVTGESSDEVTLAGSRTLALRSRWTATVLRREGHWQVASLQATVNVFDNPVLNAAKTALYWVGGGGALAGVLLGFIGAKLFGRRRP